jgi:hypothetical protein
MIVGAPTPFNAAKKLANAVDMRTQSGCCKKTPLLF